MKKVLSNVSVVVSLVVISLIVMAFIFSAAGDIIMLTVRSVASVIGYGSVMLSVVVIICLTAIIFSVSGRFVGAQWFAYVMARSAAKKAVLEADFEFRVLERDQQAFLFSRPGSDLIGRNVSLETEPFTTMSLDANNPISVAKWQLLNSPKPVHAKSDGVPLLETSHPQLPSKVNLTDLLPDEISLSKLILGVTYNDTVVTDSLKSLTHVAIAGSTRWGKSIFTQMLLYQIALAKEPTKLYLADLGGTTFVDFGLPYASTLGETELMIGQVMAEAERRKQLYQSTRRSIKSLDMYNSITGNGLPWVVMVIDEALYLMERSKGVKESLEIAVSWAAKYGITAVVISQDFKANVIATSTRNNFSSRFQFLAEDKTQANVLIKGSEAHQIENKGRCFSRLPGNRDIIELQTPYISENEILAIAPNIQSRSGFNSSEEPEPEPDRTETIRRLHSEGLSNQQIAEYFGYRSCSGRFFYELKDALGDNGNGSTTTT